MKNLCFHLNRKLWVTMAMLLTLAFPSLAQKITVTGHVADELGEDLIGATVMEKGTTNGTSADIDGSFSLVGSEDHGDRPCIGRARRRPDRGDHHREGHL